MSPFSSSLGFYGQTWKGFFIGLGLVIASFPLLIWNETSTMVSMPADDRLDRAVSVVIDPVQSVNENRLVHMTGPVTPTATLVDPELQIAFAVLKLQRQVETYQWTETPAAAGEGSGPTYAKSWQSDPIDSATFAESKTHANPPGKRFADWESASAKAKLGAFDLPADLLERYNLFTTLKLTDDDLKALPEKLRREARAYQGLLYFSADPEHPQVGDTRIRYIAVKPGEVSVIARQAANTFLPFVKQSGYPLYKIEPGKVAADVMDTAPTTWLSLATVMTWFFRLAAVLLQGAGLLIMLEKGTHALERVIWLRPLLAQGPLAFAAVATATMTIVTIGFLWLSYSWLLGGFLMVTGGLVAFLSIRLCQRLDEPLESTVRTTATP